MPSFASEASAEEGSYKNRAFADGNHGRGVGFDDSETRLSSQVA